MVISRTWIAERAIQITLSLLAIVVLIYAAVPYGVGRSSDSVHYLSAADSLRSGQGLIVYDGRPYVDWPPLYPAVLALLAPSFPPFNDVLALNAACLFMLVWLGMGMYGGLLARGVYRWAFGVSLVFSYVLLRIHLMVHSEPLFVLLCLCSVWLLGLYITKGETKWYWLLVVVVALASLQRLAGVSLALLCVLGMLLWMRGSRLKRFGASLSFAIVSMTPLLLWSLWNRIQHGSIAGQRGLEMVNPLRFVNEILDGTSAWVLPRPIAPALREFVWVILLVAGAVLIVRGLRKSGKSLTTLDKVSLLWIAVYSVFMVTVSSLTTTRVESLTERLISPVYVPVMYWFLRMIVLFEENFMSRVARPQLYRRMLTFAVLIWGLYPVAMGARHIQIWRDSGVCPYRTKEWQESQCMAWVREHHVTQRIWSNHAEAFIVIDQRQAYLTQFNGKWESSSLETLKEEEEGILVWFTRFEGDIARSMTTVEEISQRFEVSLLDSLDDGRIFAVRRKAA